MRKVLYTQRVEIVESYQERRDCGDQRIPAFIWACGYLPVPIPNIGRQAEKYFADEKPAGIILTGGNSLVKYGGSAPERDETDRCLLGTAVRENIPLYGFCRGMQSILDYFGVELQEIEGHIGVRHTVSGIWGEIHVNSYHSLGAKAVNDEFTATALSLDGVVEGIEHKKYAIIGTMWHPEREAPFRENDVLRVQTLFNKSEI